MIDDQEEYTEEIDQEAAERKREAMFAFASSLLRKRDEAVEGRAACGVERRWREDQDLFEGVDAASKAASMIDYATGDAISRRRDTQPRSTVIVNITRTKTETAAGRFSDILMPVDDKNWGLKPTPVPELGEQLKDDRPALQAGQPVTDQQGNQVSVAVVAADIMAQARTKMAGMEAEIDDQLTECEYNGHLRKMIFDSARLGTGVVKGPGVIKRYSQRWQRITGKDKDGNPISVHALKMVEEQKPASKRVDPWNAFPDPTCGGDAKKMRYHWERDTISQRDLGKLIGLDGYFDDQIEAVLAESPRRTVVSAPDKGGVSGKATQMEVEKGNLYEVWEYNGDVSQEDMEMIGCECPDGPTPNVSVAVVFVNDRPIKVALNVLDTGDLPYDYFQWSEMSDSIWGVGIPRILMWTQRIITAAWRATMDNAGDAAGAVRVLKRKEMEPADGNWSITRNKMFWYLGDDDVRNAFAQFQLDSRQGDLQAIIELALRFADMETSVPAIFQGEGKTAPETLGATNIMVDSNNVVFRLRAKRFDDQVTVPHLTRYYHFNMMYSPKDEIKGDYQVDPRGVRVLLEKDQQAQSIVALWPLMADPEIAAEVDKKKAARQIFGAHRLDILKSEDDKAGQKAQPPAQQADSATSAAQVRAQAQVQVAEMNHAGDMAELKLKQEIARAEMEHQAQMKQLDLQIEMMKMANQRNISLDSIKASLASDTMKLRTQKELSALKGPQVSTPPTEPVGKAPAGQAFQR